MYEARWRREQKRPRLGIVSRLGDMRTAGQVQSAVMTFERWLIRFAVACDLIPASESCCWHGRHRRRMGFRDSLTLTLLLLTGMDERSRLVEF
eukprot:scaffold237629_cov37-Tisochrysis_lutea.AAC.2